MVVRDCIWPGCSLCSCKKKHDCDFLTPLWHRSDPPGDPHCEPIVISLWPPFDPSEAKVLENKCLRVSSDQCNFNFDPASKTKQQKHTQNEPISVFVFFGTIFVSYFLFISKKLFEVNQPIFSVFLEPDSIRKRAVTRGKPFEVNLFFSGFKNQRKT